MIRYLHVVQGDYGQGWEDLTASEDATEALADLESYRVNEPGTPHRRIKRRERDGELRAILPARKSRKAPR